MDERLVVMLREWAGSFSSSCVGEEEGGLVLFLSG